MLNENVHHITIQWQDYGITAKIYIMIFYLMIVQWAPAQFTGREFKLSSEFENGDLNQNFSYRLQNT